MRQAKFTLTDTQVAFLDEHRRHGFKDRSAMVRQALEHMQAELRRQELEESATLCAEVYARDPEAREWVQDALAGWPECPASCGAG